MSTPLPSQTQPLPADLPWTQTAGLLLDALQVEDLIKRLYEWSEAPHVDLLYHGTQWAEISRLSPCLVEITHPEHPVLMQFLANAKSQWGYLLFSDEPWAQLLDHLRWLTSIQPAQMDEMFLRISDPVVAHALFADELLPSAEIFGPCSQVVIANTPLDGWQQFKRPGARPQPQYHTPFVPAETQWAALQAAAFRKSIGELYLHMQYFFPDYKADLHPAQRLEHLHQLANSAIEHGFEDEQEVWLYANVFGFLGEQGVQSHPDILELLTVESDLTPFQRIDRASELAAQRSRQ
ncbi:DUF4123 domain-containing protein [Pseudomonas sp. DWP3-1-2]|uniref:DUF4123 domain-containing protein n=1 Tax=Pseudomonas sp. DWP3-1-2 TaxID=2804645 RepID=UPI003CF2D70F